jgi:hypothetical protein
MVYKTTEEMLETKTSHPFSWFFGFLPTPYFECIVGKNQ